MGVLAISTAAVLIRLASSPPLTVTAWRLTIAGLIYITVYGIRTHRAPWIGLSGRDLLLTAGAALALALHFAAWIASLDFTSVVSSVVLLTTAPIWVAVGSTLFLKERPGRMTWVGILVAMAGGIWIALTDVGSRGAGGQTSPLLGDLLALAGAWCYGIYFLIGRSVRRRLGTVHYVSLVYGGAAVVALLIVAGAGTPLTGFGAETYLLLILIALVPQVIGHTTLNWALGHVSATLATVAALLEPVGAGILAWLVLEEIPVVGQIAGGVLVLAGVGLAVSGERERRVGRLATLDTQP